MTAGLVVVFLALTGCSTTTPKQADTLVTTSSNVATSVTATATTSSGTVSKAEFLGTTKPVCQAVTGSIDRLPDDPHKRQSTLEERARYLTDALRRLRALTPPTGDEATVVLILDHLDAVRGDSADERCSVGSGTTRP